MTTSVGSGPRAGAGISIPPPPELTAADPRALHSYRGKRLLDLVIIALAALPALFIGAAAALALLLDDGWPVLFRQERAGLHGRPFILFKLRTMRPGTTPADGRADQVTAVGKVLRRLSVDEIPQLLNVLRGDMSLVGPRPTLPYQVARYDLRQRLRLTARPGLTGLAQVHGRQRMSWPTRIEWDLRYVTNQSLQLDLAVLLLTVRTVLTGLGATASHDGDPIASLDERPADHA